MPKRRHILILLACGLAVVLYATMSGRGEPSYRGRSLSTWVRLQASDNVEDTDAAARAIHHIGTNAVPFLLDWMSYVPQRRKGRSLEAVNDKLEWLQDELGGYGRSATSAVPTLLNALNGTNVQLSAVARGALRRIAPEAVTNSPSPGRHFPAPARLR